MQPARLAAACVIAAATGMLGASPAMAEDAGPARPRAASQPVGGTGSGDTMRSYMQGLYDAIPFSIDQVNSDKDRPAWRARTLKDLLRALGLETFPDRTPLKPKLVGTLERDGYVVERIVFETRPGFLMTTNFYRPAKVVGKVPAVLCVHGHTNEGKASKEMQIKAINYARAGWVALTVDATGHGERTHIGHRRTWSIVTAGLTVEGVQVWDNIRCVDYLLSRVEVDPARMAITGCSGGGNQTMYTAAVDERIALAAAVCSVSTLRGQIFTPNGIGCQCECIPDLMRYGLENAVVCALIAPRPLLVLAGTEDETFPVEYTRVADVHLKRFYTAIGMAERYDYVERPVPHGYSTPLREAAHVFFDRWFNKRDAEVPWKEPETKTEKAADLWCYPDGKLPADSATLGTLAQDAARKLLAEAHAPATDDDRAKLRRQIRDEVLGGFPRRVAIEARADESVLRDGVLCQRVELRSEPGVTIRLTITSASDARLPVVAILRPKPRPARPSGPGATMPDSNREAAELSPLAPSLMAKGFAVVELEARALGEDDHVSDAAIVLGRPLVGMVAFDVSRMMDYLATRRDLDAAKVTLWAEGPAAMPALYAFALDDRIAAAVLTGLPSTYLSPSPVRLPDWTVARGLLRIADIEHLAAAAAPRPLIIANPLGPDLKPLDVDGVKKSFGATRTAYGRSGNLQILTGDEEAVLKAVPK